MLRLLVVLALLAVPTSLAAKTGPDLVVELRPDAPPAYDGPAGLLQPLNATPGERYAWRFTPTDEYTIIEFRVRGNLFNVTRVEQAAPILEGIAEDRFPLFVRFPDDLLWTADGPAQVYRYNGTPDRFVLRLGLPAGNATLVLHRDVTPPGFTLGPVTNVTHISFFQETRTDEMSYANLRIREAPGGEWIENPTPAYHVLQRFPIQGLDPDTDYEAQVTFTDWAGNQVKSDPYRVRTAPKPIVPIPTVTPLEPLPNATLPNGTFVIRASVASDAPLQGGDIRFFLDKREVREGLRFDGETFSYQPPAPLEPGVHSAAVEVTNALGGRGVARWTFEVAGAEREAPGPALPLLVLALVGGVALSRRTRSG